MRGMNARECGPSPDAAAGCRRGDDDAALTSRIRHSGIAPSPEPRMDTTESSMTNLFLQLGLPAE